jgi:hypothetical protein
MATVVNPSVCWVARWNEQCDNATTRQTCLWVLVGSEQMACKSVAKIDALGLAL